MDLIIFSVYGDDEGYFEKSIYPNISKLWTLQDHITDEKALVFISNDEEVEIGTEDIELFRYVSTNSHLANYVRNQDHYDCEWDEAGNKLKSSIVSIDLDMFQKRIFQEFQRKISHKGYKRLMDCLQDSSLSVKDPTSLICNSDVPVITYNLMIHIDIEKVSDLLAERLYPEISNKRRDKIIELLEEIDSCV